MSQETLVPDDAAQDMIKETHFTFLSLNPMEIAMQLTVNDYKVYTATIIYCHYCQLMSAVSDRSTCLYLSTIYTVCFVGISRYRTYRIYR